MALEALKCVTCCVSVNFFLVNAVTVYEGRRMTTKIVVLQELTIQHVITIARADPTPGQRSLNL